MMRAILTFLFGVLAVVSAQTPAVIPKTLAFKSNLLQLQSKGTALTQCLTKVTHPLSETSKFAEDVQQIHALIHKIQGRISSADKLIKIVMALPVVGAYASAVLAPISTVLQTIDHGLKTVTGHIDHVVGVIRSWLSPLKPIQDAVKKTNDHIHQVVHHIGKVEKETQKIVNCLNHLPEGHPKQTGAAALEKVCGTLDHVPTALLGPVDRVVGACTKLEGFLSKLHLVRRKRGLPSLHKVKSVLEKINHAFGPLGKFLDKVKGALNKKICLVGSILKIGKKVIGTVINGGKKVIEGVVKAGETVVSGVKHVAHSIGHAIHHLFGRRASDGRYYIIVDNDYEARKRGLDLCFSINNALKVVNGVTGGMVSEAQKYIGKLFHGKLGIKIPGLTSDVLNLGNVLKIFNVHIPDVASLLHIAEAKVTDALHLHAVKQYIEAVPHCKAAVKLG